MATEWVSSAISARPNFLSLRSSTCSGSYAKCTCADQFPPSVSDMFGDAHSSVLHVNCCKLQNFFVHVSYLNHVHDTFFLTVKGMISVEHVISLE